MTAPELWQKILPASSFLSGVTVSGGEPVLQADFLAEFFSLVKQSSSLTTFIETNGLCRTAGIFTISGKS